MITLNLDNSSSPYPLFFYTKWGSVFLDLDDPWDCWGLFLVFWFVLQTCLHMKQFSQTKNQLIIRS